MTWITPLLVLTSARVTFAPLTITPLPTVKDRDWPLTAVTDKHSVTALDGTSPETTWYSKISDNVALPSGVSRAARSMPASMNA